MLSLARAAPFIALFALGILLNATRGTRHSHIARIAFIGWFVVASCFAGLLQHDFWPFSSFSVFPESARDYRAVTWYEARVLSADGRESPLEPWPLSPSLIDKWIQRVFVT